jgi:hypothetical protein
MSVGLIIRYPNQHPLCNRFYILPRKILTSVYLETLEKLNDQSLKIQTKRRFFGKDTTTIRAYASRDLHVHSPIDLTPPEDRFIYELMIKGKWDAYMYPDLVPEEDEVPLRGKIYTWYCY